MFRCYNVATGIRTEVGELLEIIKSHFVQLIPIEYTEPTPGDQFGIYADVSRLEEWTGYKPIFNPERGIKDFIDKVKDTI